MAELTLEAKEEIRIFLEKRERQFFIIGASGIVTILALIGGFLAYAMDDLRTRGELAARATIESIRLTEFQPELADLRAQIRETKDSFNVEARRLSALTARIDTYKDEIEELSLKAEQALEDLNKAQGSLLFADTILEIREEIMTLKASAERVPQPSSVNTTPLDQFLDQGRNP